MEKVYGYLPQKAKNLINGIVDELSKDSRIASMYNLWYEQREEVLRTYTDTVPERIPLSLNKEFRSVKNAVIQEAMCLLTDEVTFEDAPVEDEDTIPDADDKGPETEPQPEPYSGEKKNQDNDTSDMRRQYRKAKEYLDRDSEYYDPIEAIRWLTMAANQGLDIAMYQLGKMFLRGDEVKKDVDAALNWLWKAAEKGNSYAQY